MVDAAEREGKSEVYAQSRDGTLHGRREGTVVERCAVGILPFQFAVARCVFVLRRHAVNNGLLRQCGEHIFQLRRVVEREQRVAAR